MAYTSVDAVTAEFKGIIFSDTTSITADTVDEFISQEETLLDARVANKYIVPITGCEATKIMKRLSTMMVRARILDILQVKTGDIKTEQGITGSGLRDDVTDIIDMILDSTLPLSDATKVTTTNNGVTDFNSRNGITSLFERDTKQW